MNWIERLRLLFARWFTRGGSFPRPPKIAPPGGLAARLGKRDARRMFRTSRRTRAWGYCSGEAEAARRRRQILAGVLQVSR